MNNEFKDDITFEIENAILNNSGDDIYLSVSNSLDIKTHMALSPLRQSAFLWYPFKKGSSVLLLNADVGSVVGAFVDRELNVKTISKTEKECELLKKRFANSANLCSDYNDFTSYINSTSDYYDYIILHYVLEEMKNPSDFLTLCLNRLNKDGKILIMTENRYGLKYFCGSKDPFSNIAFDSINNHFMDDDSNPKCYSKKELEDIIKTVGISKSKFYYPVPDGKMPQMIFTDEYQKGINCTERLVDYNYHDKAIVGIEHRIFGEMIDQGALPFMSNTYFIELTNEGELSNISYSVITADRGKEKGTVTSICNDGLVKKYPINDCGNHNIKTLKLYMDNLKALNIPVLDTKLENNVLSMPYVNAKGLSTVLTEMAKSKSERFKEIFDEIYGYIKKTSIEGLGTYLDLAPCNAFYLDDGNIIFYDQEFVKEKASAEFAMFRTLKYFYASARIVEKYIPLKIMYERYDITNEMLVIFEQEEKEFIDSIRNMETHKQILKFATPDYNSIYYRMKKISADTKNKPYKIGYVPGVYDLFHSGHLALFERCKERCEYLIVGVLTDELVEYYKNKRPVVSLENRMRVIEALSCVDQVIPVDFSNTDKLDAWEMLHYDCHFSGDDHINHWGPIHEELKKRGSNMEFFSYTKGISSTEIKEKMKEQK